MVDSDSCTIAVVMLKTIEQNLGGKSLPGGAVEGPFASRDVTSFQELWEAAVQIESICLHGAKKPGWAAEGMCIPTLKTVCVVLCGR